MSVEQSYSRTPHSTHPYNESDGGSTSETGANRLTAIQMMMIDYNSFIDVVGAL